MLMHLAVEIQLEYEWETLYEKRSLCQRCENTANYDDPPPLFSILPFDFNPQI